MKEHYPSEAFGSKPELDTECHIGPNQCGNKVVQTLRESKLGLVHCKESYG